MPDSTPARYLIFVAAALDGHELDVEVEVRMVAVRGRCRTIIISGIWKPHRLSYFMRTDLMTRASSDTFRSRSGRATIARDACE